MKIGRLSTAYFFRSTVVRYHRRPPIWSKRNWFRGKKTINTIVNYDTLTDDSYEFFTYTFFALEYSRGGFKSCSNRSYINHRVYLSSSSSFSCSRTLVERDFRINNNNNWVCVCERGRWLRLSRSKRKGRRENLSTFNNDSGVGGHTSTADGRDGRRTVMKRRPLLGDDGARYSGGWGGRIEKLPR